MCKENKKLLELPKKELVRIILAYKKVVYELLKNSKYV